MFREFRVYDKIAQAIYDYDCITSIDLDKGKIWFKETKGDYKLIHCSLLVDVIIEFHIGREDKKGNKIFEGDLITLIDGEYEYIFDIWYDKDFASYRFTNVIDASDIMDMNELEDSTFYVSGNIHESEEK